MKKAPVPAKSHFCISLLSSTVKEVSGVAGTSKATTSMLYCTGIVFLVELVEQLVVIPTVSN